MKPNSNYCNLLALAAGVLLAVPASAPAAIVLTLQEVGTDVVLSTPGGSINSNLLTFYNDDIRERSGSIINDTSVPEVVIGLGLAPAATPPAISYNIYSATINGPSSLGGTPAAVTSSTNSGPLFAFLNRGSGSGLVFLPSGANFGNLGLGASSTFTNTNLTTLGIAAGTYVWTIGTNSTTDTITLNVIGGASVPESASLLVPAMAISALGLVQLRRRSRQA